MQIGAWTNEWNSVNVTGSSSLLVVRLTHAIKWPNRLIISSLNVPAQSRGLYGAGLWSGVWASETDRRDASLIAFVPRNWGQMSWHRDVAFWQCERQKADSNNMSMQLAMIWPRAEPETVREAEWEEGREREWEREIVKNHRTRRLFR